jgi:hypothetical protein
MDMNSIRVEIDKMLDECDLIEHNKIAKILINMSRKSFQDE